MISIDDAIDYITEQFKGITDKQGVPYREHCIAVMNLLPEDAPIEWKLAALGHDLIEDLHITEDELRKKGFPEESIIIIKIVSRNGYEHLSYIDWILYIILQNNLGAMYVKYADNKHNSDPKRKLSNELQWMIKRYNRSMKLLEDAIKKFNDKK